MRYLLPLLVVWALLVGAAAAVTLFSGQRAERMEESKFRVRTTLAADFVAGYVTDLNRAQETWARTGLSGDSVTPSQLRLACTGMGFASCGLFDGRGVLLMNAPYFPELLGQRFTFLEQVRVALADNRPSYAAVSISPALQVPVLAVGMPFTTPSGRRVLTGLFTVQGGALARLVARSVELERSEFFVVDRTGTLAARSGEGLGAQMVTLAGEEPGLAGALEARAAGTSGDRYFASAPIGTTGWKLVATVPAAVLFASERELTRDAWRVVTAAGLLGLAGVVLLARGARRRAVMADDLARLAVADAETAARHRYALEVNDTIVQNVVAAEMALDLDQPDEGRRLLGEASRTARAWISVQLRDTGEPLPGSLVRSEAAGGAQQEVRP